MKSLFNAVMYIKIAFVTIGDSKYHIYVLGYIIIDGYCCDNIAITKKFCFASLIHYRIKLLPKKGQFS